MRQQPYPLVRIRRQQLILEEAGLQQVSLHYNDLIMVALKTHQYVRGWHTDRQLKIVLQSFYNGWFKTHYNIIIIITIIIIIMHTDTPQVDQTMLQ